MPENSHHFDATHENFESDVLRASTQTPVMVDFWAPWCAPCQALGPVLEKVIDGYKGAVKLAKVDTDKQMQLAAVFGIKTLPTVVLIKNGQIVDGFMGALPESAIREFLSRHLPALPPEHESASITTTAQSPDQAITDLRAAIAAAPDKPELSLELAKILMQTGDIEGAATELAALPANLSDDIRTKRLCSRLEFLRALEGAADTATLLRRLAQNAHDFEAQDLLGVRRVLEGELNTGLEAFLHILRTQRNWRDGQAKQRLLTAFNFIEDDDLVSQYRRKMAAVLF